jgi:hypothetical protein
LSHVQKHLAAGKTVKYHVLHGGRDAAGKYDDYESAKQGAHAYRNRMRKQGYDHSGVAIHPVVVEEVTSNLQELSKDTLKSYTQKAKIDNDQSKHAAKFHRKYFKTFGWDADKEAADDLDAKAARRADGIKKATKKLSESADGQDHYVIYKSRDGGYGLSQKLKNGTSWDHNYNRPKHKTVADAEAHAKKISKNPKIEKKFGVNEEVLQEKLAWEHPSYEAYCAHNKAKGHQVIPRSLWNDLKKNPNQPSDTK